MTDTVAPEPNAEAVWSKLRDERYQENWKMWPGKQAFYPGTQPHGALLTTYVNDLAYNALMGHDGSMPPGAIIVKENYKPDRSLTAITVMYKAPGYNPGNNDWFWLKRDAAGTLEAEGQVESCQSCHRAGRDFVMTEAASQ